jgi:hypothetical protein
VRGAGIEISSGRADRLSRSIRNRRTKCFCQKSMTPIFQKK